jgi:hypothetical protein
MTEGERIALLVEIRAIEVAVRRLGAIAERMTLEHRLASQSVAGTRPTSSTTARTAFVPSRRRRAPSLFSVAAIIASHDPGDHSNFAGSKSVRVLKVSVRLSSSVSRLMRPSIQFRIGEPP